jgi:hypothetical protein
MNNKTESGSSFIQDLRVAAARNPVFGGFDRDGRLLDVDRREVAGGSRECFPQRRARHSGRTGRCPVPI